MALGLTPLQIIEKGTHPQLVIAEDWERIELKHIASVQNGFAFSSKLFNRTEGLPLIRIRDIFSSETQNLYSGDYKDEFIVGKGDILIGMDGDFKVSKWPGERGLLNQRVCRIHFYSKLYEKEFLFLCIQPYLNAIHSETSAVTVKHLSSRTINNIPFPLPPLPIQRAIVSKIESLFSSLDSGIADLKKAQAQLKIYRQAVLKKAFEGELTKEWREQQADLPSAEELLEHIKGERQKHYENKVEEWVYKIKFWEENGKEGKKPTKPRPYKKNENISEVELIGKVGFHYVRLGEFIGSIQAGKSHRCDERPPCNGEFGIAKVSAVSWNEYDEQESKTCMDHSQMVEGYIIKPGDFLFSRANTIELVGACVIVKATSLKIMLSDKTLRLNFTYGIYNFFLYYLRSIYGRKEIESRSTGNQDSMRNIGQERIRKILIPLFSSIEQQQIVKEIESRLSVCDKVEKDIKDSLEKATALRQSILKKAFEGKLLTKAEIEKCKQESDYEPASVLLERIKKEKK